MGMDSNIVQLLLQIFVIGCPQHSKNYFGDIILHYLCL